MFRHAYVLQLCVLLIPQGSLSSAQPGSPIRVTLNVEAAQAVLDALANPSLSSETSVRIARLPGNQGIIRKLREFKVPATTQSFADALCASAQGVKVTDATERAFYFDDLRQKSESVRALLEQIKAHPDTFQMAIERRVASFTPPGAHIHLQGYVVAGGDGGGYTFGETDFYLNLGMSSELAVAKGAATHELYHAVQGAFAKDRETAGHQEATDNHSSAACLNDKRLFDNIYEEGSATYVENISLLSGAHSQEGLRMKQDMDDGLKHLHVSASLLEMSIVSLSAIEPVPYHDVYEVDFYGHGVLYNVGYAIAKGITEADGPQGLAAFLKQPSYRFVLHYAELPKYGADENHPALGPNTLAAANRIATGC